MHGHRRSRVGSPASRWLWSVFLGLGLAAIDHRAQGAAYALRESSANGQVSAVAVELNVVGKLRTFIGAGKAATLGLKVNGSFRYDERRLPGSGTDAEALRTLRHYDRAQARIEVNDQATQARLTDSRRLIVAQGRSEGVLLYSPSGPLTYGDIALLQVPGDSLALLALLPERDVQIGQTWEPRTWALPMLAGIEAVQKCELKCRLQSVHGQVATMTFQGRIEGAILGATSTIAVVGTAEYDLTRRFLQKINMSQTEKRHIGTVSPGMDVTAQIVIQRAPAEAPEPLDASVVDRLPLDPPAELLLLSTEFPWKLRGTYEREWHVFHQTGEVAILRLIQDGGLVAQCNISPIPAVAPGRKIDATRFMADIRASLGAKLKEIVSAESVPSGDDRRIYRVAVAGEADGLAMNWIYYLCTAASGNQVSAVFAYEPKMAERFAKRDAALIQRFEFVSP